MVTLEQKQRMKEINQQISQLRAELAVINPFANLKSMGNQEFGQKWSEAYVREHTPNLTKQNGAGHDCHGIHYDLIEIKSSRLLFEEEWTMNQIHPNETNAFLFVWYNCEEGTETLCFIPTEDLLQKCRISNQHGEGCYSMRATINNRKVLKEYIIPSFEELNERV